MNYSKPNNSPFIIGLKSKVDQYFLFNRIQKKGNKFLVYKGVILVCVYVLAYLSIFREQPSAAALVVAYVLMGLSGVMIVFNIVHDASHYAISNKRWLNKVLCYLGDIVGINTYIWDIRHNIQHHTFTNILGGDLIIENVPLIRLSPQQPLKSFHRFQVYYAPVLYMLYSFYWMFVIDFKLFLRRDICDMHDIEHPVKEWLILIVSKLFYLFYMIGLPFILTPLGLAEVLGLFMVMHLAAGLLLSFVAVLGHFVEGTSFPEPVKGVIEGSWGEHELEATMDFAPDSRFINWITGGLNTHVAHHLYPSICHVHYFDMTKIIEQYCAERNYTYRKDSLLGAVRSHFRYLKRLSRQ